MNQLMRRFYMVTLKWSLIILFVDTILASSIAASEKTDLQTIDEFNETTLNPEWKWKNPTNNCTYSLTINPGHLRIFVPEGSYDLNIPWSGDQNAPRVLQPVSGDFVVETKLDLDFKSNFQFAGILIWNNNTHFVRFQIGYLDSYPQQVVEAKAVQIATVGGWIGIGRITSLSNITLLRVQRREDYFTFSYATDELTWTTLASVTLGPFSEDIYIGLFVVSRQGKDAIYADFDYFDTLHLRWPSEPLDLVAEGGDGQITILWSPPLSDGGSPITNYNIYRSNETEKQKYLTTTENITVYTDEGLINRQRYYYRVSAINDFGEGALSIEVSAVPTYNTQLEKAPQLGWGLVLIIAMFFSTLLVSKRLLGWKVSSFYSMLKRRKRDITITLGWSLALGLIFIKAYWFFYFKYPVFYSYGNPSFKYGGPALESLDILFLIIVSVVAGMLLKDLESVIIGSVTTMILSFLMAFVYSLFFIWTILEWGSILSSIPYAWEYAVLWAGVNIGRIMFPLALILCLVGGVFGAVLRSWIKP